MKPKGIFILDESSFHLIYGNQHPKSIKELVDISEFSYSADASSTIPGLLSDVEIIFSGWGAPNFDQEYLSRTPKLKILFYGAGSIRGIVSDGFWERGIRVTSAWGANAVPVVEYTIAAIIFCLKRAFQHQLQFRMTKTMTHLSVPGAYGSTVGIISLGMIGKQLVTKLKNFDMNILAYDPYVSISQEKELGIHLVSLSEIFQFSDVVSLHTPWLPETEGMITGDHFSCMKENACFINTARGAVVKEDEMIKVLRSRPDLFVVLDVTNPEPPNEKSELFELSNVFLTPHIAGSLDRECLRMGDIIVAELKRYLAGEPLLYEITKERAQFLA